MSEVAISYKGSNIATMDTSGTKTLLTSGNYCEGDITVTYARPSVTPTLETVTKTYTPSTSAVTDTITASSGYDGIQEVDVTVSAVPTGSATPASSISATGATVSTSVSNTLTLSKSSVSNTPTVSAGYISSGTAGNSRVSLSATVNLRSSSDLTASGATVTAPSGYYSSNASKSVSTGTAGTPTATKGAVSNHSVSVTPSVTNTTGYITGSTKTGTAVTVSASELVSGSETKTANGTYDVTNLAELVVNAEWHIGTASVTNSSATATSISFTVSGAPKMFFARCMTTLSRNPSYKYYYVATMRWNGKNSETRGNRWYMYTGQFSNITSGYSFSYSNGTLTLSSSGNQTTSPGSFYNGTYELTYIY